jgi:hypothetical protein
MALFANYWHFHYCHMNTCSLHFNTSKPELPRRPFQHRTFKSSLIMWSLHGWKARYGLSRPSAYIDSTSERTTTWRDGIGGWITKHGVPISRSTSWFGCSMQRPASQACRLGYCQKAVSADIRERNIPSLIVACGNSGTGTHLEQYRHPACSDQQVGCNYQTGWPSRHNTDLLVSRLTERRPNYGYAY